jgi:hypothetical protein
MIMREMFLLGMLIMYLGTSTITFLVGSLTEMRRGTFLKYVFMFPFLIIDFIHFPKVYIFCLMCGIKPWHFNYSQVTELSEENQQKFIKAYPKKYQEKIKKALDDFKK